MYFAKKAKYFPKKKIDALKSAMSSTDDSRFAMINNVKLKSPTSAWFVSLFFGELGIDRFMVGDTGMGILKLCSLGCCGILYFIDLFRIRKRAKERNYNKIIEVI